MVELTVIVDEAGCAAPGSVVDLVCEAVGADEERVGCVDEGTVCENEGESVRRGAQQRGVDGEWVAVFVVIVAEESRCGNGQ